MNDFVPVDFEERVVRLRVGVEPVDPMQRGTRPESGLGDLRAHLELVARPYRIPSHPDESVGLPALHRSRSGRWAIVFGDRRTDAPSRIPLRIVDPTRRVVPRRLSLPAPDLSAVLAAEVMGTPLVRGCRAAMFPAPARVLPPGATAVRGTAAWADGSAAAWARVEAIVVGGQGGPWRAHADERGEFLLVVGSLAPAAARRINNADIEITVTVRARRPPPAGMPVDSPTASRADPLWHLPVEEVGGLGPDPVAAGEVVPPDYAAIGTRTVTCPRGAVIAPTFVLH